MSYFVVKIEDARKLVMSWATQERLIARVYFFGRKDCLDDCIAQEVGDVVGRFVNVALAGGVASFSGVHLRQADWRSPCRFSAGQ